ncbi:MAG: substrate-binding domain-containing protein [Candidatus Sericytochromatia bacterium]
MNSTIPAGRVFWGAFLDKFMALFGLLLLATILTTLSPNFLTVDNLMNVARQISIIGIVAVGMTLVIVTSGIDLSVGSVVALASCTTGLLLNAGWGVGPALLAGVVVGTLAGVVNGLVIAKARISPFIATLGMMSIARGLALVLTDGSPIDTIPKELTALAGNWGPIPIPVIIMGVVALAGGLILGKTRLGRYAYALGSNEEAVRLSGVPIDRYKIAIYALSGLLAAIAGMVLTARIASAQPVAGNLLELDAIAAVVIGGASLMGGRGTIFGTLIGVAIIGVLRNGLVLLDVSAFWQQFVIGVVIVLAVAVDQLRHRPAAAAKELPRFEPAKLVMPVVGGFAVLAFGFMLVAGQVSGGKKTTIAVIGKAAGGEYWLAVKKGAQQEAQKQNVKLIYLGPTTEVDVDAQIRQVEDLVQRKVDGIAISPCDGKALSPVVRRAIAKGIKVVTIDADTSDKDRLSYIGTDNVRAGEVAGEQMLKLLAPNQKVAVITGVIGARNLTERQLGFKKAVGDRLVLLNAQTDNSSKDKALAIAENTMTANPDVAAFFTDTAISGPAVAQALETAGKQGTIKLISFDTTTVLLKHLRDGNAQALIAQRPEKMGELGVSYLVKAIRGETIPAQVDTGVIAVTKSNVTEFAK